MGKCQIIKCNFEPGLLAKRPFRGDPVFETLLDISRPKLIGVLDMETGEITAKREGEHKLLTNIDIELSKSENDFFSKRGGSGQKRKKNKLTPSDACPNLTVPTKIKIDLIFKE